MAGSDPNEALSVLKTKITAKAGKVESSFSIRTGGTNKMKIEEMAREAAGKYK
jgi:hypothetical protein